MEHPTLEHADVKGRRVLVRVDFNVPIADGRVVDDARIRAALPTIQHLVDKGARLVLMSHLGRPKGSRDEALSLAPVATHLEGLLGRNVAFAPDCIGSAVVERSRALADGQVLLLENLRFHKAETENEPGFAQQLAELGDLFVNDAFGTAHRAHASTVGVADHLPAAAGFLMAKELAALGKLLTRAERPFAAVVGGAKVSGKVDVLENLLPKVDALLIGGAMAFTFSRALGGRTGDSLVETDRVETARRLILAAKERGVDLRLPVDIVATRQLKGDGEPRTVAFGEVEEGWKGVDIGPRTVQAYAEVLAGARTVLLNGPMGVFEVPPYHQGTCGVLDAMASNTDATTVLGGGDSAAAATACRVTEHLTHVSTGGGATLEFLAGRTLPGVAALARRARHLA